MHANKYIKLTKYNKKCKKKYGVGIQREQDSHYIFFLFRY